MIYLIYRHVCSSNGFLWIYKRTCMTTVFQRAHSHDASISQSRRTPE